MTQEGQGVGGGEGHSRPVTYFDSLLRFKFKHTYRANWGETFKLVLLLQTTFIHLSIHPDTFYHVISQDLIHVFIHPTIPGFHTS